MNPLARVPTTKRDATHPGAIFVSIASYRDPDTKWTIHDLFARAAHPSHVHVGVCFQLDPATDGHMSDLGSLAPLHRTHVRCITLPHVEATGPWKARALAGKLWAGEPYVMQVDAHCRFIPRWDDALRQ